jgi:hypothetical protein
MRWLALALLCLSCRPLPPPVTPISPVDDASMPAVLESDAGTPASVLDACVHLCHAGCATWCAMDERQCESDLPNLLESGLRVDLGCLSTTPTCDDAKGCVQ